MNENDRELLRRLNDFHRDQLGPAIVDMTTAASDDGQLPANVLRGLATDLIKLAGACRTQADVIETRKYPRPR